MDNSGIAKAFDKLNYPMTEQKKVMSLVLQKTLQNHPNEITKELLKQEK